MTVGDHRVDQIDQTDKENDRDVGGVDRGDYISISTLNRCVGRDNYR